ncbi:MAG: sulfotransferase domain-containing protein, partial [Phormidesmis sp.]
MTLPNTLIIGAQKAGSSWLSKNLSQHPEVFVCKREVHYFNLERHYRKGISWYERRFEQVQDEKVIAEKTPNYLWITPYTVKSRFGNHLGSVHQKMHAALPEAKLIVVLRNPVERAISAVNHYRTLGQISPFTDIDTVLDCRRLNHQNLLATDGFGIFSMGRYYEQLSAYYKYYRRNQILIVNFETEITADPQAGLQKVCDFLEIDSSFDFRDRKKRQNKFDAVRYGTALARHLFPKRMLISKAVS